MERKFRIGDSKVLESRETGDGRLIRRRRESSDGHRFTTYERIEMPPLTVTKRSGNKEIYDRDKLLLAVKRSVGKFFNSELEVEDVVNRASDILYGYGTDQITSKQIGEAVLDVLAEGQLAGPTLGRRRGDGGRMSGLLRAAHTASWRGSPRRPLKSQENLRGLVRKNSNGNHPFLTNIRKIIDDIFGKTSL